jgi:glycerol-3-phosphate dehydrogenase
VQWTPVPNLAEHQIRPYRRGGEIVCHCEWVTRAEIEAALQGPLPAGDLGGLKRRTRAMMGRCQGFNCGAEVRDLFGKATNGKA